MASSVGSPCSTNAPGMGAALAGAAGSAPRPADEGLSVPRCSGAMSVASPARISARSITLRNSRTLPGQS